MTRFDPNLIITRLVVKRNDHTAYDEIFHEGVNVIRGENSSGKSTILNLIFYGLGGDLTEWSETALLCTRVIVEARINGSPATLSRDISQSSRQPMEMFGGDYEKALKAPREEWLRYPYQRTANLESFSQALFRLLGMPEVVNELSGTITIHQILRLLYSDQLSPVESIFRHEARFDPPILRDAIGRLLCGSYEAKLYSNEVSLRELNREFDAATGELRSLFAVLGKTEHSLTMDWLAAQRASLGNELKSLQTEIEKAEQAAFATTDKDKLSLDAQRAAYNEVQQLQSKLVSLQEERDSLALAVVDSASFIRSLEEKIAALKDSSAVAKNLGGVDFSVCPVCYSPVSEKHEDGSHACYLCKTPFEPGRTKDRIVAIINDASIQLKQSRMLQKGREERASALEGELAATEEQWRRSSDRLASLQRLPSTETQERLRKLQRQSGYVERQLEDLDQKAEIIQLIDKISAKKDELNARINALKSENERLEAAQRNQLARARTMIADEVRTLLMNDLRRQDSFESPKIIEFDFAANRISVDGHSYFSASSRVILRSSFYLGFFGAANKDPTFRHPRFLMIDTTEDKGMEPERSHNFQNQILKVSKEAKTEHQVIYATSMISPDLDDEEFLIGKFSTRDEPTLDISPVESIGRRNPNADNNI
jgi:hypothetical protein